MAPDNAGVRQEGARATLSRLLADHGRGAAMYGSGFSMHLPMVLIALFRMGATSDRLEAFASAGRQVAEPRPAPIERIEATFWERELGKHAAFMPYRVFFTDELARADVADVLARFLPRLLEGLAAAGFHAIIRLAYGLDLGSRDEIAAGLAYLASAFDSVGAVGMQDVASARSIPQALEAAHAHVSTVKEPHGRIIETICNGMRAPAYAAGLAIDEGKLSLPALADAALQTYLAKPSIYTVHLVTAVHALKVIGGHYPIDRHVLRIFWRCLLGMHVAVGATCHFDATMGAKADDDWNALFAAAISETDDHAIKFTYSCSVLARALDDDRFRFAAARMLHRAETPALETH